MPTVLVMLLLARASRREAMLDACAKRATPIVMTTIAMAAGTFARGLPFSFL